MSNSVQMCIWNQIQMQILIPEPNSCVGDCCGFQGEPKKSVLSSADLSEVMLAVFDTCIDHPAQ